jgi:hypothetical protein
MVSGIFFIKKINIYHRCKRGEKCAVRRHGHEKNISQYLQLNKKYYSVSKKYNLNDFVLIELYEIFWTKHIFIFTCVNFFNYFLKILETVKETELKELLIIYFYYLLISPKIREQKQQLGLFLSFVQQAKGVLVNLVKSPVASIEFKSFMNDKIKPALDKI